MIDYYIENAGIIKLSLMIIGGCHPIFDATATVLFGEIYTIVYTI